LSTAVIPAPAIVRPQARGAEGAKGVDDSGKKRIPDRDSEFIATPRVTTLRRDHCQRVDSDRFREIDQIGGR
jgi:hypothetical protein